MNDLPFSEPTINLLDKDLPDVSILCPCWRRRKFVSMIIANITGLDYPKEKLELCILQDGDQDLFIDDERYQNFVKLLHPVKVNYIYEKDIRRTIGEKRNKLVKMASHKYCANMDSDDIYIPSYIRHSINSLKEFNAGITTSASMLFVYPKLDFKTSAIHCIKKVQGHEACCVYTKKYFNSMKGYNKSSQGEGVKLLSGSDNKIINLDISKLMICVAHDGSEGNTINKDQFKDENPKTFEFMDGPWKDLLTNLTE
tara:strand:+ start:119 stop:883 length:765 start_codon:yes stop_codon:yes gene_type:complete